MFPISAYAFAQDASSATQTALGGLGGILVPMIIVIGIFYFLIIRPQQKERRKHQELLENLKSGDKVVTTGGIIGTIHSVSDTIIQLKIGDKMRISVLRSAIRGLMEESEVTADS